MVQTLIHWATVSFFIKNTGFLKGGAEVDVFEGTIDYGLVD